MGTKEDDYSLTTLLAGVNLKKYSIRFIIMFIFGILFGFIIFPTALKAMIAKVLHIFIKFHVTANQL